MPVVSRRHVLISLTGAACACTLSGSPLKAAAAQGRFCLNRGRGGWTTVITVPAETYARAGNTQAAIKAYLDIESAALAQFFKVGGKYHILQQHSDEKYRGASYDFQHDMIELGEGFLPEPDDNFQLTAAIFAHEAAHRFQYKHGIDEQLKNIDGFRVKYVELHADYMAGAYMASVNGDINIRDTFFHLGDLDPRDEDHHGFRPERYIAFHRGFMEYRRVMASHPGDIFAVAFAGVQHVQCLLKKNEQHPSCKGG